MFFVSKTNFHHTILSPDFFHTISYFSKMKSLPFGLYTCLAHSHVHKTNKNSAPSTESLFPNLQHWFHIIKFFSLLNRHEPCYPCCQTAWRTTTPTQAINPLHAATAATFYSMHKIWLKSSTLHSKVGNCTTWYTIKKSFLKTRPTIFTRSRLKPFVKGNSRKLALFVIMGTPIFIEINRGWLVRIRRMNITVAKGMKRRKIWIMSEKKPLMGICVIRGVVIMEGLIITGSL